MEAKWNMKPKSGRALTVYHIVKIIFQHIMREVYLICGARKKTEAPTMLRTLANNIYVKNEESIMLGGIQDKGQNKKNKKNL
jgi:hypothetical protein